MLSDKAHIELYELAAYVIEENFSSEHVEALRVIATQFNKDENTEKEVFAFANMLKTREKLHSGCRVNKIKSCRSGHPAKMESFASARDTTWWIVSCKCRIGACATNQQQAITDWNNIVRVEIPDIKNLPNDQSNLF